MRGKRHNTTEDQLEAMHGYYLDGHTLEDTATHFQMGYGYLYSQFKRRDWLRGKNVRVTPRPVQSFDDGTLRAFKAEWDKLDSTVKGTIAENYVKVRLSELGFDVWEPVTQNHKTDVVILVDHRVIKIQVKAATYDTASKSFRTNLTRHRRMGGHPNYSDTDVDFFIVYCGGLPALTFYVIPAAATNDNATPRLFPHREKAVTFSDVSFEDYRNAFALLK